MNDPEEMMSALYTLCKEAMTQSAPLMSEFIFRSLEDDGIQRDDVETFYEALRQFANRYAFERNWDRSIVIRMIGIIGLQKWNPGTPLEDGTNTETQ